MKIVYQTDDQGFFTGPVQADPSPLEPGVWLIPGGAVEIEPPVLSEGERAWWNGAGWTVIAPPPPPEPEPEPTAEELLAALQRKIIAERDRRIEALGAGYTPTERELWPVQIAEAQSLLADPDAPAPMLRPIAASRGVTSVQMAERVMQLASAKAAASGAIMAAGRRLTDAVDAGTLPQDWTDDRHWV